MTATCVMDRKMELYEQLRTHGWIADNEPSSLRREVYLMAWRVIPSVMKEQLHRARAAFRPEQHEYLERKALRSLPPYHQLVRRSISN